VLYCQKPVQPIQAGLYEYAEWLCGNAEIKQLLHNKCPVNIAGHSYFYKNHLLEKVSTCFTVAAFRLAVF
jgi:hypothetical protein